MQNKIPVNRVVTLEDLDAFKVHLLFEFQKLLINHFGRPPKKWLKSNEVKTLLDISHGTLQNMRDSGKLSFTRIGGVIYYDFEDIQEMLKNNMVKR